MPLIQPHINRDCNLRAGIVHGDTLDNKNILTNLLTSDDDPIAKCL